jgi:hypothetical protein
MDKKNSDSLVSNPSRLKVFYSDRKVFERSKRASRCVAVVLLYVCGYFSLDNPDLCSHTGQYPHFNIYPVA